MSFEPDESARIWRYFELHAKQRMTVFNFFVVLLAAFIAGISSTYQYELPLIQCLLCISIIFFAYVFNRLDQRNCFFIKRSERALARLEDEKHATKLNLFATEVRATKIVKKIKGRCFSHLTFGNAFSLVYGSAAFLGFVLFLQCFGCWLANACYH